jgi:hypothetical protein
VGAREYDLKMSYDFNTRAHTQWFYFAITNMQQGPNTILVFSFFHFFVHFFDTFPSPTCSKASEMIENSFYEGSWALCVS